MRLRHFLRGRLLPCALLVLAVSAAGVFLMIRLPRALAPLAAAERIFSFAAGIFVAVGREGAEYKLPKLLLLLLPWTGAALCLLMFPRIGKHSGEFVRCSADSSEYFSLGAEMRERLLADIANAERAVWLQYYIIAAGKFCDEIFALLKEKAAEGVDVRVLYDDFGCSLTLPPDAPKRLRSLGIEAKALRRVSPSLSLGRREHRKIAAIDFRIAYTGGVNLADEYVGETVRFGHWKDTAVRVTGTAALALSALFARTWGDIADMVPPFSDMVPPFSPEAAPSDGAPAPSPDEIPRSASGDTSPDKRNASRDAVFSDPADRTNARTGHSLLCALIGSAERRAFLFTPYLAPDGAVLSALIGAAKRGVDVRLMIPHVPDKKLPFLLTRSYARDLEKASVRVREYTAGFLHAKSVLSDDALAVSSYNLDFRSFFLQSECGVLLRGERHRETVDRAERDFLSCWEQGSPVPDQSRFTRAAARLLRLFAPLF